ncbi:MAG: hypothetical protein A4S09_03690 [Proteobacteria bacterium SG_bin7]|nr:MAG: hypothetical protein A4S09_03690 [Proteobacteria bacterium SG_bin7]
MRTVFYTITLISLACTSAEQKPLNQSEWQLRMREISVAFAKLVRLSYLRSSETTTFEKEAKELARIAQEIDRHGQNLKFDKDPVLKFVARDFSADMQSAYLSAKSGNVGVAKSIIRSTSNYCISCHTRNDQGIQDTAGFLSVDVGDLKGIEKADYFAAVRQFLPALNAYDQVLTSPRFSETNTKEWTTGMKKSLAIAVRVERNPSLTLELISRVFDAKSVPLSFREAALTWRRATKEWRDTEKKETAMNNAAKVKEARLLVHKGQLAIQETWNSEAGLIYFLRASSLLNDIVTKQKEISDYSEVLYLSGLAAEALRDVNLWTFDEIYYESCIRAKPHSENSRKCFTRYEALQFLGESYHLDENTTIEPAQITKLKQLKELAL